MRAKIIVTLCLAIFTILLASCKSEQNATNANTSNKKLTTISIVADSEQALALFKMEEKNIEQKFGVRLEYHYPSRLDDNLEPFLFASKQKFDIYILFPAKLPEYVDKNMLLPLDKYLQNTKDVNDILPVYRNLYMKLGSHNYGMVYDGDAHLLFYRKDIFAKYNAEYKKRYGKDLTPPQTWEEYDQIAKFLTRDTNNDGKIDLYGTAIFGGDAKRYIWFAERYLSMGDKYFDKDMNPLITGKDGVKALQDLINLNDSGATPPNSMYDWIDLNNAFLHGELAMTVQWSDTARDSFDTDIWKSTVANKVDWTLVPTENPNNPRGGIWIGRVLSISSQSPHPDKAWQVISYITSKAVSAKGVTSKETVNCPFRYSHFSSTDKGAFPTTELNQHLLSTVKESLNNTNSDLMIPGGWEYMQALDQNIYLALIHKETAQKALQDTAAEWNKITDHYGRAKQEKYYQQYLDLLAASGSEMK